MALGFEDLFLDGGENDPAEMQEAHDAYLPASASFGLTDYSQVDFLGAQYKFVNAGPLFRRRRERSCRGRRSSRP